MNGNAQSFTAMDHSTREQWMTIAGEPVANQSRVADLAIDQRKHCLQTATRAQRAGADEEMIVASLCHDIGKVISVANHPRIAAEILKPYVRDEVYRVITAHQDFQGRHYYEHLGMDPNSREQYRGEAWFELAATFADDWDQSSFDPDYDTESLEYFEPLVRRVFATPRGI
ncbi:MAG: HD domain-containing protein [Actinobacteria bacterium]|nr:HD domain-containing protein [Actinomycetota bacterium]